MIVFLLATYRGIDRRAQLIANQTFAIVWDDSNNIHYRVKLG